MTRLLCALAASACLASSAFPAYLPLGGGPPGITDLVAIYLGASYRPAWTTERFAPYVAYADPRDGKERWLFDGFLFLDFTDGQGHMFSTGAAGQPAGKAEWARLLDADFGPGGIPALDEAVGRVAARLGEPLRRRQVVLTIPTPIAGFSGWGEAGGRRLDFARIEDRVAACAWVVGAALERWRAMAPRHLDLAGFYWDSEDADGERALLPRVAEVVHAAGLSFVWIPYWRAGGAADWRALGFDAAWQQPNAFFHPDVPLTRLDDACAFGHSHGMGLEMEVDGRVLATAAVFGPRFDAYLEAFARHKVARTSSIAYYEGGGALLALGAASDPASRARFDRLCRFVARRQKRAGSSGGLAGRGLSSGETRGGTR